MTDIVERLRVFNGGINDYELWPKGLRREAADEIERLRKTLVYETGIPKASDGVELLAKENERLTAALWQAREDLAHLVQQIDAALNIHHRGAPRDDGTAIAVGGEPGASAGKSE